MKVYVVVAFDKYGYMYQYSENNRFTNTRKNEKLKIFNNYQDANSILKQKEKYPEFTFMTVTSIDI